jgi:hypothetical protein
MVELHDFENRLRDMRNDVRYIRVLLKPDGTCQLIVRFRASKFYKRFRAEYELKDWLNHPNSQDEVV